ncbi:hypothetical protein NOCA2690016 [metagenome]|uniref:Uncharacterized protein n=1 Tax=metagenome TaxID=256318 RepID=A0A2P2CD68_9ZZZZ
MPLQSEVQIHPNLWKPCPQMSVSVTRQVQV